MIKKIKYNSKYKYFKDPVCQVAVRLGRRQTLELSIGVVQNGKPIYQVFN